MLKPDRAIYTPTDFLQWRDSNSLDLTPKFQRRNVWKPAARSFFIDTILRQMPVPPIYLRTTQSIDRKRIVREVIDGQQRVSAVLAFIDGEYSLSRALRGPWSGKTFLNLSSVEQDQIRTFGFSAEVFHGISDLQVLEIFARLNTYSVPLNSQELRNGRYFGFFKQSAYALAYEYLEFWRKHRIFSEQRIARMLEVEFVSEIIIAQIDGMQDKKTSIDDFYERYDEDFKQQSTVEKRFREVADTVDEITADQLRNSEFRRTPLLYTLFCVIHHRMYGLRRIKLRTPKKALAKTERASVLSAVIALSDLVTAARNDEQFPVSYTSFVNACLTQTDNIKPRQERFKALYLRAFS
jgi:hypothetical protein